MGYKKPERRDLSDLLHPHIIAGQMRRDGWHVRARCLRCHMELWVSLDSLIRLNGHDTKLWGRSPRCRRVGCEGRMIFLGSPPGWHPMFWPLMSPPEEHVPPFYRLGGMRA